MNAMLSNQGRLRSLLFTLASSALLLFLCSLLPTASFAAATITYVQGNYAVPQTSQTSVPITFTAAQTAGDLNVVAVGWNDTTAAVSSVTDKSGNTYALAVGPTVRSGALSQSIYYAKNIAAAAAGANVVTVTFSTAAVNPDIRILEYQGADPNNPVDVTAAGSGSSATSSSGSATTTNATDLLFGANIVQPSTTGAGSGFTKRLLTSPDGDIAEDDMLTATGSHSATAPLSPSGAWVMQMVAFRTPVSGGTTPTVTSVSPNTGSTTGGTTVTITGTNFASGATVTFGTAAATSVAVTNSTTITVVTPAGSTGAVSVTVTVSGTSGSLASGFTYVATPTVSSVSPNTGSTAGGTSVTITGTNFVSGATVNFGTSAATSVTVVSSTSITAKTPAGSTGAVSVTVSVSGQSGSLASAFTYVLTPTVTGVSPNTGSTAGGTPVTITGTNFASGATVTFGTAAATSVVVINSTTITAVTPAGSAGAVTIAVSVSGQSGSLASAFTYVATPTVIGVSPNTGSTAGGTSVTITGTNFASGATVTFGTAAATSVVVVSSTSITAKTPAGSTGAVTVTVSVSGQSGSLTSGFTYAVIPTVTGLSPNTGSTAGGTPVTITGTNFASGATVTFGTAAATSVVVTNSTTITAVTPAGSAGAVTVTVSVSGQSGSLASGFTYVATPTVTGVSPNTGSTAGGTAVTITGTNFASGATVTFGTAAATSVTVVSSTSITATTPAASTGAVTVTVAVSGQSGSLTSAFTYAVIPTVNGVSPNSGTTAGGTAVTITGTNFASGATVTFGTAAATSVVVGNSTTITALTPAVSAGAVTVTVSESGHSGSLTSGFTYIATPTVTSVTPNTGSTAGGTAVTITGANFASGASVTFGTAAATSVVVVSNTSITAKTPAGSAGAVTVTVTNTGAQSGSLASGFTYTAPTTITYVQGNYAVPQTAQTSVPITFTAAQTAGDLNVVVVGWNDTSATVSSVTDKSGNIYSLAVGPTLLSGVLSQSIYYARNITAAAAGANIVTVVFSKGAANPDIRILEYKGADPNNPVDVTAASSGSSTTTSSGAVTTSNATDLLFGANIVVTTTTGPGSGFTSRLLTSPDGDIAEDEMLTATGSHSATAPVSPSGGWIMQLVAFRTTASGGGDTTPPTAPSNLAAVTASPTQINLSWTASTDNVGVTAYLVERCQGVSCTSFAQIGTSTTTTYSDMGLSASTSYSYRVRATDAAGNLSQYSNTATAVTAASSKPTAPTNVSVANGGPAPILITAQSYDNPNLLSTHTMTAFNSTGGDVIVLCSSSHMGVTFTPTDNYGNVYVPIAGPTNTATGFDLRTELWYVQNPIVGSNHIVTMNLSIPESLVISVFVVKGSNISSPLDAVSTVGSDNGTQAVNTASPSIFTAFNNDLLIGFLKVSAGATFTAGSGFTLDTAETYNFLAGESGLAANQLTSYSATFSINTPQTWQSAVVAVAGSTNQNTLSWSPSTESGGTIASYLIWRCQGYGCTNYAQVGTSTTTSYIDTGLSPSTSYNYEVQAEDTSNTIGPLSSAVEIATPATIPSLPGALTATTVSTSQINLAWSPAAETGGSIANYNVQRCLGAGCTNFTQVGTSTTTTYSDIGLAEGIYNYQVSALDASGNIGPFSNMASGTTLDTQPPTAPANLSAGASGTQINLTWTASTDNFGVTGYIVERCQGSGCTNFAQVGTSTTTTYSDTGLAANTSYSYVITATDAAGNVSQNSNTATVTTGGTTASTITYVQGNYAVPQTPQTSVPITFTAAQATGDLNVVVVGWNDSNATVSSVTDKSGNTYSLAVGPTVQSGVASQSIYYARNIAAAAAGANIVTVTFSTAAANPDIRILEYSGADPNNPVDVTAANSGTGTSSSSGAATTTNATDLLFGANLVQSTTTGAGSGFTKRLLTNPDGDIAEDRMVTGVGSYTAIAATTSGQWIMQMVAFRTPVTCSSAPPTTPTNLMATASGVNQINLTWTASTSCLGVANYVVQRCQGTGCTFATVGTATGTTFNDIGLMSNTTYSYQVEAKDNQGNTSSFSTPASATTQAISISPLVTVLTVSRTQQFTSAGSANVTWSVDGLVGGTASTGTITTGGLYTPPASAGTHTITVTISGQSYAASATVYVTNYPGTYTYHNDNSRSGQNLSETVLTTADVNPTQFGKISTSTVDGQAIASPLYVANVSIAGGTHNVVYVATEHDSVFAFDADGLSTAPLWQVSFINPSAGVTTLPAADTDPSSDCCDLYPEVGITSTPVIDPTTNTIYVVAATKEVSGGNTSYVTRLHALDITSGAEKFGGPVIIQASVPGTGDNSSGGNVGFDTLHTGQRPGLLLTNGTLYIGFGGHDDVRPYHGWILGYSASTLQQTMAYNVSPNGYAGGVWQSGGGLSVDVNGYIYFSTGNGDFNTSISDYGDSIIKLSTAGAVLDYFTPYDQANMNANDLDLASSGPVLLIDQAGTYPHLLVSAGKTGTIYVVDRDNMGHNQSGSNSQIVQSLVSALPNGNNEIGNYSPPVYFNGNLYFCAVNDSIRAFQLSNGLLSTSPESLSAATYGFPGGSMAISANGSTNGILWAVQMNGTTSPGVLFAYDATNLSKVLYNSSQSGSRDTLDVAAKFSVPLVANGRVYVASNSQLTIFGLLP